MTDKPAQSACPVTGGTRAHTNRDWWPNQLNLGVLHQHSNLSIPHQGIEVLDHGIEVEALELLRVVEPLAGSKAMSPRPSRCSATGSA